MFELRFNWLKTNISSMSVNFLLKDSESLVDFQC